MNILFDGTILTNGVHKNGGRSGIYTVAHNLFLELLKADSVNVFLYCSPERYDDFLQLADSSIESLQLFSNNSYLSNFFYKISGRFEGGGVATGIKRKIWLAWKFLFVRLGKITESKKLFFGNNKIDVYFSPMESIPACICKEKDIKKVIIIYDLIPYILPEYRGGLKGWFGKVMNQLNKNDYYFTISDSVKKDFINLKGNLVDESKIFTTYIGISDTYRQDLSDYKKIKILKKYKIKSDKYIFSLGSIEPRKNLKMQIKAFVKFIKKNDINDFFYIIGGGKYTTDLIAELQKEKINTSCLQYIGYIDDIDLNILYSNALWFTFTSKYEGFGLPPLEAMKCGCPVIASNNSSLPEVCGDAALLINCNSIDEHVKAYEDYFFNIGLREENRKKGFLQSQKFSWSEIVKNMISIINEKVV